MLSFSETYTQMLKEILLIDTEINNRTGVGVRTILGGESFWIDLNQGILPTIGLRRTYPRSAAAEVAWYISGDNKIDFISKYAPFWDKFTDTDESGETVVKSAYGYRWRRHFGRDQLRLAIDTLKKDPTNRRVLVSAWDPSEDGLGAEGQKNVPCPAFFTLNITRGELHSSLFLRSSDLVVGLPYDVMGHALLMDAIAAELVLPLGIMHVTLADAHVYECHIPIVRDMLKNKPICPTIQMPRWSISDIELKPDTYVEMYGDYAKTLDWPAYTAQPEIIV